MPKSPFANMKIGPTKSQTSALILMSKYIGQVKEFKLGSLDFNANYIDTEKAVITCEGKELHARFTLKPNGLIDTISISGDGELLTKIAHQDEKPRYTCGKFSVQSKAGYMNALKRAIFSNQLRDLKYAHEKSVAKAIEAKVEASRPKTVSEFPDLDPETAWQQQKAEKAKQREQTSELSEAGQL